ncbi:MAG: DUF2087 domain-containing protein [candidate division Zixibacteria bacterium]|nr:DUF2087 domain-containing protein [candidate division Zixibacteria bacterium]
MSTNKGRTELKFYTTAEVAELLKMNVQVIARKLQHGELPGYKIGKDWRVRESDLIAWLDKHSNQKSMNPAEKVIGRFMKDGRFGTMPVQRKKRRYILEFILESFKLNQVYSEDEVNDIITRYYDDYCWVRREFISEKMMFRKDGSYRRNSGYRFTC